MGKILYGDSGMEIIFDDRDMAHLQLVIGAKLRRRESFFFTWKEDPTVGEGRSAIWIDAAIPMYFKFYGSKQPTINRDWLELLTLSANSAQGMQFMSEPVNTSEPEKKAAPKKLGA